MENGGADGTLQVADGRMDVGGGGEGGPVVGGGGARHQQGGRPGGRGRRGRSGDLVHLSNWRIFL